MRFIDRLFGYGVQPFNPVRWSEFHLSLPEREELHLERMRAALPELSDEQLSRGLRHFMDALYRRSANAAKRQPDLDALAGLPVFAADDVARYVLGLAQQGGVAIETQVATMAPPFDEFWVDIDRVPNHFDLRAWGPHVTAVENNGSWQPLEGDTDVPRWQLSLDLYVEIDKQDAMGPIATFVAGLAEDGTWFRHSDGQIWWGGSPTTVEPTLDAEEARSMSDSLVTFVTPALMTISMLHCRNVKLNTVEPNEKLSRRQRKRTGGRPLVTYHELDFEPMRRLLDQAGAQEGPYGLRRALHICRGHFKVFTDDAPLFGRHTGTYWWAPQVRGSASKGIALKDYRVAGPSGFGRAYREAPEEVPEPNAERAGKSSFNPDAYGRGLVAHNRAQNALAEVLRTLGISPLSAAADEPDYDLGFEADLAAPIVQRGLPGWVARSRLVPTRPSDRVAAVAGTAARDGRVTTLPWAARRRAGAGGARVCAWPSSAVGGLPGSPQLAAEGRPSSSVCGPPGPLPDP